MHGNPENGFKGRIKGTRPAARAAGFTRAKPGRQPTTAPYKETPAILRIKKAGKNNGSGSETGATRAGRTDMQRSWT
jgi:hypothetical protein